MNTLSYVNRCGNGIGTNVEIPYAKNVGIFIHTIFYFVANCAWILTGTSLTFAINAMILFISTTYGSRDRLTQ
jgi:hypothetical protein